MKFFLDTANLDEIREAATYGIADGVTTNPTLISKEGNVDFKEHIAAICEIVKGPVSAECTSEESAGMLQQGREYAKIAPNVVIKCPLTREGLKATRQLNDEGIKVNVTLCFSAARLSWRRKPAHHSLVPSWDGLMTLARMACCCCRTSSRFTETTIGKPKCWRRVCVTRST